MLHPLIIVDRIGEDPLEEPNNLMPYVAQVGYDHGDDDNVANDDDRDDAAAADDHDKNDDIYHFPHKLNEGKYTEEILFLPPNQM